jgi:hypothetical protein
MTKKPTRKAHLPRRDDLPFLKASTARKAGTISPPMTHAVLEIGGHKAIVTLWHTLFPKGGSWSRFICPSCSRRCQVLRLYDGRFVCPSCDGLLLKCQTGAADKTPRIERLRATLAKAKVHNRTRPEIALRRALIVERRKRLEGWPAKKT